MLEPLGHILAKYAAANKSPRVVVLTGAGISAESGIRTFRDTDGTWENHNIEEVGTAQAVARWPDKVRQFYNERRRSCIDKLPNDAHLALREIEKLVGDNFFIVTQNVDDLHEKAGSSRVCHMHGELCKVRCHNCQTIYGCTEDLGPDALCEACGGRLRPHIVLFDEMPFFMPQILNLLRQCDIFVAIGTSGVVFPAAGFHEIARSNGAFTIEVNLNLTGSDFDYFLEGLASETVPMLADLFRKYLEAKEPSR